MSFCCFCSLLFFRTNIKSVPRSTDFRRPAMESRSIQQQLRHLQDRIELLHANLQAVSSKTLSNSRTCSLEDRLNQLEQDQQPPAPSLASEILDDISRQMGIFDQQLQTLENKIKNYLDKMDEKIQCCNDKVETYQNEYYEWMEQWWKEDNLQTYRDLPSTLTTQAAQIKHILEILQKHGLDKDQPKDSSRPSLVHFPKWRPRSPPTKRPRCSSPRLHQGGAADD